MLGDYRRRHLTTPQAGMEAQNFASPTIVHTTANAVASVSGHAFGRRVTQRAGKKAMRDKHV